MALKKANRAASGTRPGSRRGSLVPLLPRETVLTRLVESGNHGQLAVGIENTNVLFTRNYEMNHELDSPTPIDASRNAPLERASDTASSCSMHESVSSSGKTSLCDTHGKGSAPSLDSDAETLSDDNLSIEDLGRAHRVLLRNDERHALLFSGHNAYRNGDDRLTDLNIAFKHIETIVNTPMDTHIGARSLNRWLNADDGPWTHLSPSRATKVASVSQMDGLLIDEQLPSRVSTRKPNRSKGTQN